VVNGGILLPNIFMEIFNSIFEIVIMSSLLSMHVEHFVSDPSEQCIGCLFDEFNSYEEVFAAGDDMEVAETVPEPIPQSPPLLGRTEEKVLLPPLNLNQCSSLPPP
jgi:hypothetical protein